jgi:hypothetical protein
MPEAHDQKKEPPTNIMETPKPSYPVLNLKEDAEAMLEAVERRQKAERENEAQNQMELGPPNTVIMGNVYPEGFFKTVPIASIATVDSPSAPSARQPSEKERTPKGQTMKPHHIILTSLVLALTSCRTLDSRVFGIHRGDVEYSESYKSQVAYYKPAREAKKN